MKRFLFFFLSILSVQQNFAQPILDNVLKENREKLYRNIVSNSINRNLSKELTDSTEENWQDAFWSMELIHYRSPWINNRINIAMNDIQNRSASFQRAMLELIYTNYPTLYVKEVNDLLLRTMDIKVFTMCEVYMLRNIDGNDKRNYLIRNATKLFEENPHNPLLDELVHQLTQANEKIDSAHLYEFLEKKYLPGNVLLISFQRRDRNYPGLVLVRDANGNFVRKDDGDYFAVPQLARSITNLPGYLTNGNTPEGIFRMDGFDHSKSSFIGPTTNVQLTMPFESDGTHFYKDSSKNDNWLISDYKNLLPESFKDYRPMLQSFYAGLAGRTEIIAHGSTVDPKYYEGQPYYPITPTQGCLCTKEIWSETTGTLIESDQQLLANAITKAGGPNGYAIVINIDNKQEPVSINDILPFLKLANQN